jgi:hypothetical protein
VIIPIGVAITLYLWGVSHCPPPSAAPCPSH